jgi:recombination protein RecR
MHYPDHLLKLIAVFKKLPGVGSKSAERFAFHLLEWPEEKLNEMSLTIGNLKKNLKNCAECGCIIENGCPFCQNEKRDREVVCVVASHKDVFLIEQTHEFRGVYHVLGGVLSPLQGRSCPPQAIEKLKRRIQDLGIKEMILALDATLEGDATALYLKKELELLNVAASRLALGLPMGSSLDFIDGGTLARALAGRHVY